MNLFSVLFLYWLLIPSTQAFRQIIDPETFHSLSVSKQIPYLRSTHHDLLSLSTSSSTRTVVSMYKSSSSCRSTVIDLHATMSPPSLMNQMSFLPSCPVGKEFHVAGTAGIVSALSQWILYRLFKKSKRSVLQNNAAYTAHSVVALSIMILVSTIGVMGWWCFLPLSPSCLTMATRRLLHPSSTGRWLASIIMGSFLMWDIPTSISVPELRKLDVIIHHVVMLIIAAIGATILPMNYILYYFGVAEISSVPLVIYDQINNWLGSTTEQKQQQQQSSILLKIEGVSKVVAAVSFTLVRVVSFTNVTVRYFLPDCWSILSSSSSAIAAGKALVPSQIQRSLLKFLMVGSIGFTILQLYWFSNMVKVIFLGNSDTHELAD